jgi:D-alanyl-D-alanine carboxypeptidase
MSTGSQQLTRRIGRPRSAAVWALLAIALVTVAVVGGIAVTRDRTGDEASPARPELQLILDELVTGPDRIAPGATAYVAGPHGTWLGSAGVADLRTGAPMPTNARMRLESVTKLYTATLILQLAQERKLRVGDSVARWLPGLLPYGDRITIRQLLTMRSGLIDDNDIVNASESEVRTYLGRVKDAKLRTRALAIAARVRKNPAGEFSPMWWIRLAAWQPLLFAPGSDSHYSNIGYDVLGLIAARAGAKPLAALYRERILAPLGLGATAYAPQGPIAGPHARGYGIEPDGAHVDTTDWHAGVGAGGGIVSDARDTATFLTALMRGTLLDREHLVAMEGADLWLGGAFTGCGGRTYGWGGAGWGYKTDVWADDGAKRVVVLLLNGRQLDTAQLAGDLAAHDALESLYCAA